jgi:hypothetical protein
MNNYCTIIYNNYFFIWLAKNYFLLFEIYFLGGTMMKKLQVIAAAGIFAVLAGGCSSSDDDQSGSGGTGTASTASLSSLPSVDLSNYDYSGGGSAKILAKTGIGENIGKTGSKSRAGCEADAHRAHIIMESKMAQLDRCYPEAMEAAGEIIIPDGSYAYYKILVPDHPEEIDGFIKFNPKYKLAKSSEPPAGGPRGGTMLLRIGRGLGSGLNEMHIDMCTEGTGAATRMSESTYAASGSVYNASVVRKGSFGDEDDSFNMAFELEVDAVSVSNGIADLGSSGSVKATGRFIDPWGRGQINYQAEASTRTNIIYGGFGAEFVDDYLGGTQKFDDKMYSSFGGDNRTGTGKWLFSGTFPAFPVSHMMPPEISEGEKDDFYKFISEELGTTVDENNVDTLKVCPNPACDHDNPTPETCGMIVSNDSTCVEDGHAGIESFAITGSQGSLIFAVIDHSLSPFYNAVNGVSFSDETLFPASVAEINYSRDWNCQAEGDWIEINPEQLARVAKGVLAKTPEEIERMTTKMAACIELENDAMKGGGMGEFRCHEEGMKGEVEEAGKGGQGGFDF